MDCKSHQRLREWKLWKDRYDYITKLEEENRKLKKMKPSILPKTIIIDIDGCLVQHVHKFSEVISNTSFPQPLEKIRETCMRWHCSGHKLILMTGRPEPLREDTEIMLKKHGILYNQLIMDAGPGPRILVNDLDPKAPDIPKACAINLERNIGISVIDIDSCLENPFQVIKDADGE
jgi:hypothetical protein